MTYANSWQLDAAGACVEVYALATLEGTRVAGRAFASRSRLHSSTASHARSVARDGRDG